MGYRGIFVYCLTKKVTEFLYCRTKSYFVNITIYCQAKILHPSDSHSTHLYQKVRPHIFSNFAFHALIMYARVFPKYGSIEYFRWFGQRTDEMWGAHRLGIHHFADTRWIRRIRGKQLMKTQTDQIHCCFKYSVVIFGYMFCRYRDAMVHG